MFDKLMYNTSKIEFTKDSNLFLIDRLIIKGYRSSCYGSESSISGPHVASRISQS